MFRSESLGVTVHRCLQGKAPQYLVNCCHPTLDVASRQRLRSSSRHHLVVPRHHRSMLSRRAFSVAGPMAWNALPDDLRDPSISANNFRKTLKDASVSECTWTLSSLEALRNALYKFKTYLLSYLPLCTVLTVLCDHCALMMQCIPQHCEASTLVQCLQLTASYACCAPSTSLHPTTKQKQL